MPLQDKNRPGRKVTARKVLSSSGRIFDSAHDFAEEYDIAVQTAYNIIRRKQVFHGLTFRYMDDAEQTEPKQPGTTQNSLAEQNRTDMTQNSPARYETEEINHD